MTTKTRLESLERRVRALPDMDNPLAYMTTPERFRLLNSLLAKIGFTPGDVAALVAKLTAAAERDEDWA